MLKLSFILPCYNVASYVGRCIESIERIDIPKSEYEVICVDDCSKDKTIEVIKEYQKRYSNIQLICHETNQTAGGARNTGMDAAKGEYLWFVDPDDAIIPEEASAIYTHAYSNDVSILVFNYTREENGEKNPILQIREDTDSMSGQEFFLQYFPTRRMADVVSIWRLLYKRAFCKEKGIRYPEIKAGQDVVFAWTAFLVADKMAAIPNNGYVCHRRPTSTTGSKGCLSARAIISQSLLFAYEIYKLQRIGVAINPIIYSDLDRAMGFALNNDSRNLLYTTMKEQKTFYNALQMNKDKRDALQGYMNRKTKNLFAYTDPYLIWQIKLWVYRVIDSVKHRKSISY